MRNSKSNVIYGLLVAFMLALIITSCDKDDSPVEPVEDKHWSYSGDTGPEHWAELDPDYWLAANGKNQSPIDISTTKVLKADLPNIEFHYEAAGVKIENNGHAIEVVVEAGSYIVIGGTQYDLIQFHFHSSSEHTVDGSHSPIEGHWVHKSAEGNLAVVGLMIEEGAENASFKPIWDHLPATEGEEYDQHAAVNPLDLLPSDKRCYHYSGSLTTPPCSEGVNWSVLATPVELSATQIAAFEAVYDHNYRPIQAVNARTVILDISE